MTDKQDAKGNRRNTNTISITCLAANANQCCCAFSQRNDDRTLDAMPNLNALNRVIMRSETSQHHCYVCGDGPVVVFCTVQRTILNIAFSFQMNSMTFMFVYVYCIGVSSNTSRPVREYCLLAYFFVFMLILFLDRSSSG